MRINGRMRIFKNKLLTKITNPRVTFILYVVRFSNIYECTHYNTDYVYIYPYIHITIYICAQARTHVVRTRACSNVFVYP